ncbi:MAG: T9SS type A sorting domain-containing protein, partial [Bacteroidota bacterium]
ADLINSEDGLEPPASGDLEVTSARLDRDERKLIFEVIHQPNSVYQWALPGFALNSDGEIVATLLESTYTTGSSLPERSISGKVIIEEIPPPPGKTGTVLPGRLRAMFKPAQDALALAAKTPSRTRDAQGIFVIATDDQEFNERVVITANGDGDFAVPFLADGTYDIGAIDFLGGFSFDLGSGTFVGIGFYDPNEDGEPDLLTVAGSDVEGIEIFMTVFPVTLDSDADVPMGFTLGQSYPNPFNPSAQIPFTLEQAGPVTLTVHDLLGREVARLADGLFASGTHTVTFDAANLPSGTYLYRLEAGTGVQTRGMSLLR